MGLRKQGGQNASPLSLFYYDSVVFYLVYCLENHKAD